MPNVTTNVNWAFFWQKGFGMKNRTYHPRGRLIDGYAPRKHPSYSAWVQMKARCTNSKLPGYKNYGGRGITYDPKWEHFAEFVRDMGIRPSPQHSIERVDNNGDYTKENCIWATRNVQAKNRRKFESNTTGETGVNELPNGRYVAVLDYDKVRYKVGGSFPSVTEAAGARAELLQRLLLGLDARDLLERPARYDSKMGIRGVSPHKSGGYTARVTVNGERIYLGHFKTVNEATEAIQRAKQR